MGIHVVMISRAKRISMALKLSLLLLVGLITVFSQGCFHKRVGRIGRRVRTPELSAVYIDKDCNLNCNLTLNTRVSKGKTISEKIYVIVKGDSTTVKESKGASLGKRRVGRLMTRWINPSYKHISHQGRLHDYHVLDIKLSKNTVHTWNPEMSKTCDLHKLSTKSLGRDSAIRFQDYRKPFVFPGLKDSLFIGAITLEEPYVSYRKWWSYPAQLLYVPAFAMDILISPIIFVIILVHADEMRY